MLAGFVLLFYAVRHLLRRNRVLFIPGEFFVLVLYMGGTWLGPLVSHSGELISLDAMVMIMFAAVLLMNLGLISLYDIHLDSRLGLGSLASRLGQRSTRNLVLFTGILVYIAAILQFLVYGVHWHSKFALILSGMCTILLLILLMPSAFRKNDLFRLAADAVLYLGFLSLLIT
jgi:4-hydroxybenzoate polyprenyltransferase